MSEWVECPKCGVMYKGEHRCSKEVATATSNMEEDRFAERNFINIKSLRIINSAEGADRGFWSIYDIASYPIEVEEKVQMKDIQSVKGDESELIVTFIRPITIKVTNGFRNRPFDQRVVKTLEVL